MIQVSVDFSRLGWNIAPESGSLPFGSFINRNHAADFIGMSLGCALGLAWHNHLLQNARHHGRRLLGDLLTNPKSIAIWLTILALVFGLAICMSRGGWLSSFGALVLVAVCWRPTGHYSRTAPLLIGLFTIALAFGAIHAFGLGDQIAQRLDDLETQQILADTRLKHWEEAWPAAMHYLPFGSGLGTYGYAYLPFGPEPEKGWFSHAHNQYLEVLMEAGVPGALLVVCGLWLSFRFCVQGLHGGRSKSTQAIAIAAMFALSMQAFHALTDFGLMMPGNLITLAVLLGVAAGANNSRAASNDKRNDSTTNSDQSNSDSSAVLPTVTFPSHRVLAGMYAVVLTALCVGLWHQGRHVRAERLLADTKVSLASPSPSVQVADLWINRLRHQHDRWIACEPLLRRIVHLQLHREQRATYDQIRSGQLSNVPGLNPMAAWEEASLESLVMNLYADSAEGLPEQERQKVFEDMQNHRGLTQTRSDLQTCLALNPLQPQAHLRMALLQAACGTPWHARFEHSVALSVVDPKQSLGNGLLAWAAGDVESMIQQWRRS